MKSYHLQRSFIPPMFAYVVALTTTDFLQMMAGRNRDSFFVLGEPDGHVFFQLEASGLEMLDVFPSGNSYLRFPVDILAGGAFVFPEEKVTFRPHNKGGFCLLTDAPKVHTSRLHRAIAVATPYVDPRLTLLMRLASPPVMHYFEVKGYSYEAFLLEMHAHVLTGKPATQGIPARIKRTVGMIPPPALHRALEEVVADLNETHQIVAYLRTLEH